MPVLGIDIGATKIAAGVVDENAAVLSLLTVPTRAAEGFEVSFGQLRRAIRDCLRSDITAIGICAPGPLNPKPGFVINPPNLPGWRNIPLAEEISREFGLPCRVENDANAAGLAEARFGTARGYSNVFYVTWSTGIGAGIILDGRIYHGKNGAAGATTQGSRLLCGGRPLAPHRGFVRQSLKLHQAAQGFVIRILVHQHGGMSMREGRDRWHRPEKSNGRP